MTEAGWTWYGCNNASQASYITQQIVSFFCFFLETRACISQDEAEEALQRTADCLLALST